MRLKIYARVIPAPHCDKGCKFARIVAGSVIPLFINASIFAVRPILYFDNMSWRFI